MFKQGRWKKSAQHYFKLRLERVVLNETVHAGSMVQVEYGLTLLSTLHLPNESVLCLSDLLTLHNLPSLQHLSDTAWKHIQYARYRIPHYTSHQRWRDDLLDYADLPDTLKLFDVHEDIQRVTIASMIKDVENPHDLDVYRTILQKRPPYYLSWYQPAEPGQQVAFYAESDSSTSRYLLQVTLPEHPEQPAPPWANLLPDSKDEDGLEQFVQTRQKPERTTFAFDWQHILDEADILQKKDATGNWADRTANMGLQHVSGRTENQLIIDGMVHLAGMVGSGKSTLVKILTHRVVRTSPDRRITILVPSTMDAFNMADELNRLFQRRAADEPIAVAYYGWSNRDRHINMFLDAHGKNPEHTGHRWTATACAILSLIHPTDIIRMDTPPRPGTEPCESLRNVPGVSTGDHTETVRSRSSRYSCPFLGECPSRQLLRDLAKARVIVTTAGALQSRLPSYVDPRRLLLADYLYEQTDILFVDEADEVQAFEDNQFVNSMPLWGLPNAVFSSGDEAISRALVRDSLNELQENWSFSLRDGVKYILPLLRMLHRPGNQALRRWLGRSYFSSYRLFQTLSRRMLGIPDWFAFSEMSDSQLAAYEFVNGIFSLLISSDFTRLPDPDYTDEGIVNRYGDPLQVWYACKLRDILGKATTSPPRLALPDLEALINRLLAEDYLQQNLETNLTYLHSTLKEAADEGRVQYHAVDRETSETLIQKLLFALLAAGLDREIRIVVYNSDARPISDVDTTGLNPRFYSEHQILPLAYTGPIFGTYFTPDERNPEQEGGERGLHENLSRLEYINPGRELLLSFQTLYELFGIHGPHVVFLSGTSYLPDSTRWHIRTPIKTILEANPYWRSIIREKSEYSFRPAFAENDKGQLRPVRISGAGSHSEDYQQAKLDALRQVAMYWAKENTLHNDLLRLQQAGDLWSDRDRLLLFVNSYDQAKELAMAIRQHDSFDDEQIRWLTPTADDMEGGLARASIEQVAKTNLKILVAPLLAIGRGHNILTADRNKAAFGGAYFVVRPLNPPGDVNGIAAEINCYGDKWLQQPHPDIASQSSVRNQEIALRRLALSHWHQAERRTYYKQLSGAERNDLAATTFGRFVQAAGRLVRGGVPVQIRFIDAAWAPESARYLCPSLKHRRLDTVYTSLLVAMICRLKVYTAANDPIGQLLYAPFAGLEDIGGLRFRVNKCEE